MVAAVHIFEDAFSYMDSVTTKYMTDGAASVASSLQGVAYSLLALYMVLWGWSMMRGMIQEPVMDAVSRILRLTFIITFATNSVMYANELATFLYDWPPAMVGVISGTPTVSITQLLDQIAASGLDLASQAWQAASIANLGAYFVSIILFALTITITSITAFIIIGAKLALALLLTLGPLFILMMIFKPSEDYFSKWLASVFTSGITIVLASMAAMLFFKYFDATFNSASAEAAGNGGIVTLTGIAQAIIFGLISGFFILGIPNFSSSLGGGASGASASALGWAMGKAKSGGKIAWGEASGRSRSDRIAARRARLTNARWAKNNPSNATKAGRAAAAAPAAVYRKITSRSNRIKSGK
jgi:type IV secretion system protein VirB6